MKFQENYEELSTLPLNAMECDKLRLTNGRESYLRVFRGISKLNLPGYLGFFQFLRNVRQQNAFAQAGLILRASLDPTIARKARRGELVKYLDHFDLLQSAIH